MFLCSPWMVVEKWEEDDGEGLQSRVQVELRDVGIGDGTQERNSGTQELRLGDVIREEMSLEGVETRVEL